MKFWQKGLLCFFLLLAVAEKENTFAMHAETNEVAVSDTELRLARQHLASATHSAEAQGTLTSHPSRAKFDMEWLGSYLNGVYTASRPNPVNHPPTLLAGRILQHTIDQLHQTIQRKYALSYRYSIGLKPLPVCRYYVFALRRILI